MAPTPPSQKWPPKIQFLLQRSNVSTKFEICQGVRLPRTFWCKSWRSSVQVLVDVKVEQCRKFIVRAEKRVAEFDAERTVEFSVLTEAKGRLQRLEAEQEDGPDDGVPRDVCSQAAATNLPEPSALLLSSPGCAEIVTLKAMMAEVEVEGRCDPQSADQMGSDHVISGSRFCIRWGPAHGRDLLATTAFGQQLFLV